MGIEKQHGIYAVQVDSDLIGGITQQAVPLETVVNNESTSGQPFVSHLSITSQKPSVSFTTLAITAALDALTAVGKSVGDMAAGVNLYAQKRQRGGIRAGVGEHTKYHFHDGLIHPGQLTCEHGADASLTAMLIAIYDGVNLPLIVQHNQNLPAGMDETQRFSLGPVYIGGVLLSQVESLEIDFGIRAAASGSDGEVYPTFVSIDDVKPEIVIRGSAVDWVDAAKVPLTGLSAAHATTKIYLRRRQTRAMYYGDGVATHVKFTAAGMAYIDSPMDGSGIDPANCTIRFPLDYDGTNYPLVVSTDVMVT